jgi:hypothetical protein
VAKHIQSVGLDHGKEMTLPCLETGSGLKLLGQISCAVKILAVYLRGRRRRATVESFIPRESCDRESRLEFERFIHW